MLSIIHSSKYPLGIRMNIAKKGSYHMEDELGDLYQNDIAFTDVEVVREISFG